MIIWNGSAAVAPQVPHTYEQAIEIRSGQTGTTNGLLSLGNDAWGLACLSHYSSSEQHFTSVRFAARMLRQMGLGTLMLNIADPFDPESDPIALSSSELHVGTARLLAATHWIAKQPETEHLQVGFFGFGLGVTPALIASSELPRKVGAVAALSWLPDLSDIVLNQIQIPTLLMIGGKDLGTIRTSRHVIHKLGAADKQLEIVPEASTRFSESGTLEAASVSAGRWFSRHLQRPACLLERLNQARA